MNDTFTTTYAQAHKYGNKFSDALSIDYILILPEKTANNLKHMRKEEKSTSWH